MLVKIVSSNAGELLMLAETAKVLFQIMEKESGARGVFTFEQLPEAITKLRSATKNAAAPRGAESGVDDKEMPVGLAQRAFPLIDLMERTLQNEGYVMWEASQPF